MGGEAVRADLRLTYDAVAHIIYEPHGITRRALIRSDNGTEMTASDRMRARLCGLKRFIIDSAGLFFNQVNPRWGMTKVVAVT
jgi:hypothetical protein